MSSLSPVLSNHDRKLQQLYRLIGVPLIHAAALLAFVPYFFTWTGVASAVLGYLLIALLGVNIGYHRLLAHRSIACPKGVERALALLGVLNVQFGPAYWVAIHRRHHQLADSAGDPHTPRDGFWRSHLFFLFPVDDDTDPVRLTTHYAKDLLADPFYAWFEKRERWFLSTILVWPLYFLAGYATAAISGDPDPVRVGWSVLVWGVFVRLVVVWHITFAVNSVTHIWGFRTYRTADDSRNNPLVAVLAWGEGWHNNHHAFPRSARHGHAWWQLDATWLVIRLLAALKIVTINNAGPSAAARRRRRLRSPRRTRR